MSNKNNKKYTPTKTGYKEEEKLKETVPTKSEQKEIEKLVEKKEEKETKKETPLGVKLENADNMDVPYPELGGHTVSQLSQFQEHKRKAILGAKDAEFCKKYHL